MTISFIVNTILCVFAVAGWVYAIRIFFDAINIHWITRLIVFGFLAFLIGCFFINFVSLFAETFNILMPYVIPSRVGMQTLVCSIVLLVFIFVYRKRDEFHKWSEQFKDKKLSL